MLQSTEWNIFFRNVVQREYRVKNGNTQTTSTVPQNCTAVQYIGKST